eukprot:1621782-Rhodomonas_salina.2
MAVETGVQAAGLRTSPPSLRPVRPPPCSSIPSRWLAVLWGVARVVRGWVRGGRKMRERRQAACHETLRGVGEGVIASGEVVAGPGSTGTRLGG